MDQISQLMFKILGEIHKVARAQVAPFTRGGKFDRSSPNQVGRTPPSGGGTGHGLGAEPPLGNPASDGYVLASTTAGVRSWVVQGGGGNAWSVLTNGDPAAPQLVFDSFGDVIMTEVAR